MEQNNKPHTCEEYVIDQLHSAHKQIGQLLTQNKTLETRNKELEEKLFNIVTLIDAVKDNAKLTCRGFMEHIDVSSFYRTDKNYDAARELFDIREEHTDDKGTDETRGN